MMARHSAIDHRVACELILDYARLATGHALPIDDARPRRGPHDHVRHDT